MSVAAVDHLRLVFFTAKRYTPWGQRIGLSAEDLHQEGFIALMRAARRFDETRGLRFSTVAVMAIRNRLFTLLERAQRQAAEQAPVLLGEGGEESDFFAEVPDRRSAEEIDPEIKDQVGQLLGRLDERERCLVEAYFGLGGRPRQTAEELAAAAGVSGQRVRQVPARAIRRLRRYADSTTRCEDGAVPTPADEPAELVAV